MVSGLSFSRSQAKSSTRTWPCTVVSLRLARARGGVIEGIVLITLRIADDEHSLVQRKTDKFLHDFWRADAEPGEGAHELALRNGSRGQQKLLPLRIWLRQNMVFAIEVAELLGKLKGVLGQIRRLRCGDALIKKQ